MSNEERDELFQLMLGRTTTKAVERILAAGYRKPRTITTAEELDALPNHTMIHTADGDHAEHVYEQWFVPGVNYRFTSGTIALPATVTWEPQP